MLGRARRILGGSKIGPTLDLNFASGTMPAGLTFSRASNATMIGPDGVLGWAPHNLLLRSESFVSPWIIDSGITINSTSRSAPDGSTTATEFQISSGDRAVLQGGVAASPGQTVTVSIYAKCPSGTAQLRFQQVTSPSSVVLQSDIFTLTAEWVRYSFSFVMPAGETSVQSRLRSWGTGVGIPYQYWGAQLNLGPLQPYYPTTGSPYYGPRIEYDPLTLECKGLLMEPAGTNTLVRSTLENATTWPVGTNTSVTSGAVAPDGSTNAVTVTTSATANSLRSDANVLANTVYTLSFWAKLGTATEAKFSVYDASNAANIVAPTSYASQLLAGQWRRVSLTFTTPAGCTYIFPFVLRDSGSLGTVQIWGAQLETGPVATSYIPTAGASATRAADIASINTLTPWFNQTEGTLFAEVIGPPLGSDRRVASLHYGFVPSLDMVIDSGGFAAIHNTTVSALATLATVTVQPGSIKRIATTLKQSNWVAACGGESSAPGTVSVNYFGSGAQSLWIGGRQNASGLLNSHIRRLRYYPVALPAATLQALTR